MSKESAGNDDRKSDTTEEGGESSVRAVDRAIAILNAFSVENPSMSVIEIQKKVGLSRPTLYRLLSTLSSAGLVTGEGDPQRFRLGHGVMHLANVWLSTVDVVDVARAYVQDLRDLTGETAGLFLLRDHSRLCALEYKSREVISYSRGIGNAGEIDQGATGKAILAAFDDDHVDRVMDSLKIKGDRRAVLREAVAQTRARGYALSFSEIIEGAVAIAAPFFDHNGAVAGSVGLFGPQARLSKEKVEIAAQQVVQSAKLLSERLGWQVDRIAEVSPVPATPKRKSRKTETT